VGSGDGQLVPGQDIIVCRAADGTLVDYTADSSNWFLTDDVVVIPADAAIMGVIISVFVGGRKLEGIHEI
jgi:hypothetical protein